MLTRGPPRNHAGHVGCGGAVPLTLADREAMHGRPFLLWDEHQQSYCARCLDDLPHGLAAWFHVCADELPPVGPGDVVRYHGSLAGFRGTVWEVTVVDGRGRLCLFDVDRAMSGVRRGSVTLIQRATRRKPS